MCPAPQVTAILPRGPRIWHLAASRGARATEILHMIGIIGGTGLYRMEGLEVTRSAEVDTPFGRPSGPVMLGRLAGRDSAFLPRHGLNHDLLPSEINFRANIWALKSVGVRTVIGVSAVG